MKRIILALTIISLIGISAGVVNENGSQKECPPGEACITSLGSSSSASATTAVGPNGTAYSSELSMTDSTCLEPPAIGVSNVSFSGQDSSKKSVSFDGQLQTSNPCYTLNQETTEVSPGVYRLNVTATQAEGQGPCVQCVGAISYEASFETDQPFKLEVIHEGKKVETLEHPDFGEESSDTGEDKEKSSFMSGIMNWFKNMF
jgi:hypothetical protein